MDSTKQGTRTRNLTEATVAKQQQRHNQPQHPPAAHSRKEMAESLKTIHKMCIVWPGIRP